MKSLRETAFHEAGHVVIAYRLSLGVGIVTIAPDDINLGSSLSEGAWLGGGMAEEVIVTYYAGYAAECLCDPDADRGGSESDDEKARELLAYCPGQTEAALRERARELVEKYRAEIEAVADALLEYTTLYYDEGTLVCDAIDEGLDWRKELMDHRSRWGEHYLPKE
jgi:ATP-dependent Zn protease